MAANSIASPVAAQVVPLADAGQRGSEVGAKAARLGALLRRGERVPDGFCVIGSGDAALALALEAYRQLGSRAVVAVRSSASAEDGSTASFAGQFDTVLNVGGEDALATALARCWSSASNERVQAYRGRRSSAAREPLRMAVLVQQMVAARAAGVAFSANPLTGAREEVVIHAAAGLGDAVVSGETTPDEYVVDSDDVVHTAMRSTAAPILTESEARAIAALARRVEADAGMPQDIEWALDASGLWLLQARPITALPVAVRWESPVPGAKWWKDLQTAEWAKEPPSPLGATTTFETMAVTRERRRSWPPVPRPRLPGHTLINGWLYLRADMRPFTLLLNVVTALLCTATGTLNGHRRVRRTWPKRLRALDALERLDLADLPDAAVQAHTGRLLRELAWWWWEVMFCAAVGRIGQMLISQLNVPGLADPSALFRGNDSLLLEAERALQRAAADPAHVDAYLSRFGHFVESADPIHPTLRDSPAHLTWQLAAARQSAAGPDERLARARGERAAMEATVRAWRGPRGFWARRLLTVGQSHAAHTDDAVFHFQRLLALLRATFLEVGRRLAQQGRLAQADDVFYLEHAELWMDAPAGELAGRVAERRASRERRLRLAPPPFVPRLSDPAWSTDLMVRRMPPEMHAGLFGRGLQERDGRRVLIGTPGSPGRARGIARVVAGPGDFERFVPGDVLVTHATSPIWTPLLGMAAAAVTEVGGPSAHAAIVAREFGIPLVDGALDATRVIADGMPIVVDGSAGVVEL